LDIYDVIIHLKSDQITNQMQSIDFPQKYPFVMKEFDAKLNERMPIIDFNPIHQFVEQLRSSYSEFALFFYDRFGGREIGVLWKPSIFESRPFKISQTNAVLLCLTSNTNGSQNIVTNIEAIIEDFSILGDGIVKSIETRTEKWQNK
jgi:U3 small nucleolar RNA-associated protein 22